MIGLEVSLGGCLSPAFNKDVGLRRVGTVPLLPQTPLSWDSVFELRLKWRLHPGVYPLCYNHVYHRPLRCLINDPFPYPLPTNLPDQQLYFVLRFCAGVE
jgi:hypothetical protein